MMDIVKTLQTALVAADSQRDRSLQVEIGASAIGGCRTQAWHTINGTPTTNEGTESLAAIIGTAIHDTVQKALSAYDLFGEDFLLEEALQLPELKGHADFYSKSGRLVADWKTTTLKKIANGTYLDKQKKIQVQLYAKMLAEKYPVERVALVFIPRDGRMRDIVVWEDIYRPELANEGLAWLREVKAMETAPAPERSAQYFCRDFCKFYDETGAVGCKGK